MHAVACAEPRVAPRGTLRRSCSPIPNHAGPLIAGSGAHPRISERRRATLMGMEVRGKV